MGDVYSAEQTQFAVREIALLLLRILERLEEIADDLPQPPDPEMDAMLEGSIPMSLAVDLRGSLEVAADDCLRPAIKTLEEAAKVTPDDLRREFEQRTGKGVQRPEKR
ncbi:MAG TPA: hypothetical protein VOA87_13700 [Thermoanaerobaculia bacterium]|nr:hypothetical protein [Thermoanaerobaculia bacterium]